ncbi:PREDICTED: uncharacterized protein [Prunus dulcis]|uniref:PREDICTED: uncharacterized protein n=1 Tax=Prunus dulcis TaxID=3755 RepID=A0A5E4FJB7_PRUDU|nr:PREDICTED: uncharacterized protein [Prunus dulcis]
MLDHLGSSCDFKSYGTVAVEQYGQWKTAIKDVFSICVVVGLKGRRFGLFEGSKTDTVVGEETEGLFDRQFCDVLVIATYEFVGTLPKARAGEGGVENGKQVVM